MLSCYYVGTYILKGAVARVFDLWFFSMNQYFMDPWFIPNIFFESCFELADIRIQNLFPRGLIPRRNLLSGVSDPAEINSEGSGTPWKLVRRGLITRLIQIYLRVRVLVPVCVPVPVPVPKGQGHNQGQRHGPGQ
jgi:hypothetical protein